MFITCWSPVLGLLGLAVLSVLHLCRHVPLPGRGPGGAQAQRRHALSVQEVETGTLKIALTLRTGMLFD